MAVSCWPYPSMLSCALRNATFPDGTAISDRLVVGSLRAERVVAGPSGFYGSEEKEEVRLLV